MTKAKLMEAKSLIQQKQYDQARAILKTVNHPTAEKWLTRLDELDPPQAKKSANGKRLKIGLLVAGLLVILIFAVGEMQRNARGTAMLNDIKATTEYELTKICRDTYRVGSQSYNECMERARQ